jgi:phage baseplate assembly protein W
MKKRPLPPLVRKITHRDFDLQFRRHPTNGKVLMKKDDEALKQAIKNLILTDHFERPFRPEFGGNIRSRLFDLYTSFTKSDFENLIVNAIETYEPRALLDTYSVNVRESSDTNEMFITIRFRNAVTLNDIQLDISLNRVR